MEHLERAIDKIRAVKDGLQEGSYEYQLLDHAIMLITHETIMVDEERERGRALLREMDACCPPTIKEREAMQVIFVAKLKDAGMRDVALALESMQMDTSGELLRVIRNAQLSDRIRTIAYRHYGLRLVLK